MKPFNRRKSTLAGLLYPLWWCLGWGFNKSFLRKDPATILIFDFHLIGDIVLLMPLLRALRKGYPGAHITLVAGTWAQDILKNTEWVDDIVPFLAPWVKSGQGIYGWKCCIQLARRLKKKSWDLGIEVRGDVRQILLLALAGAKNRVSYDFTGGRPFLTSIVPDDGTLSHIADHHRRIAEHLGIWPDSFKYLPSLTLTDEEILMAQEQSLYCGFHFGASLPLRRLPQEESLLLVQRIAEKTAIPLVLFSSPDDPASSQRLYDALPLHIKKRVALWSGTLRGMIVMLSRATHIYCMDSGTAHIAAALGIPVTVIYGPADSRYVYPIGANVTIIERHDVSCRPCDQIHCTNSRKQRCLTELLETIQL